MLKNKIKKIHILIVVYVILIITELFFCVPYHSIQIFKSKQNVPHTEIIGSGYTTMADIQDSYAFVYLDDMNLGKVVNTPQVLINVSITTLLAAAIYFLFIYGKKKPAGVPTGSIAYEQLSLFDTYASETKKTTNQQGQSSEEPESPKYITVHTLSPKNGYYKDAIERTEENSALIDKWTDKTTGCLYLAIMYRNGEAESMFVTKEFFDTLYKHFDL